MRRTGILLNLIACFFWVVGACNTPKHVSNLSVKAEKTLIASRTKGWLKYNIYQMPLDSQALRSHKRNRPLIFSIRIINMENDVSPLRRISSSLKQYDVFYEYLLNQTKNDLALVSGTTVVYPSYYSFENSYNVFPFETVNVGFSAEVIAQSKFKKSEPVRLLYADKVFAHDTLTCDVKKLL